MASTHFILCTLGTRGDILPFAALAAALVARGERVTVLANANWAGLAQASGAAFLPIAPADPAQCGRDDFAFFQSNVLPSFRRSFEAVRALHAIDARLMVIHRMGMHGAQCAAEKLGIPSVKVALQPSAIRSSRRPAWPLTPLARGRWRRLTRPLIPAFYLLRELTGRYRPLTNGFRRAVGLRPLPLGTVHRIEDLTLMMCPRWFAMPQADWPRHCHCVGFPFGSSPPLDEDLTGFISRHGAPLVFTPGTGVVDTRGFFQAARRVCELMRLPGVFLGAQAGEFSDEQTGARVIQGREFVELGSLLPASRLLVHHGGIGTTAQAVRAGIPQLILPGRFDQPDNAMRIANLRLGAVCLAPQPDPESWCKLMSLALHDVILRRRLAVATQEVRDTRAAEVAASLVQELSWRRFGGLAPGPQMTAHQPA